jgi:hypothetical protein
VSHFAPTELSEISRNAFYKHSAPLALRNQGFRQQYRTGVTKAKKDRTLLPPGGAVERGGPLSQFVSDGVLFH